MGLDGCRRRGQLQHRSSLMASAGGKRVSLKTRREAELRKAAQKGAQRLRQANEKAEKIQREIEERNQGGTEHRAQPQRVQHDPGDGPRVKPCARASGGVKPLASAAQLQMHWGGDEDEALHRALRLSAQDEGEAAVDDALQEALMLSLLDNEEDQLAQAMALSLSVDGEAHPDMSYEALSSLEDVASGVDVALLSALPISEYKETSAVTEKEVCHICLGDYEDGDQLMRLPCLHCFHMQCVGVWLERSRKCPTCNEEVCAGE